MSDDGAVFMDFVARGINVQRDAQRAVDGMTSPNRIRLPERPQRALRKVTDVFKANGWRDVASASTALLDAGSKGLTVKQAALVVPDNFYVQNSTSRRELAQALLALCGPPEPPDIDADQLRNPEADNPRVVNVAFLEWPGGMTGREALAIARHRYNCAVGGRMVVEGPQLEQGDYDWADEVLEVLEHMPG